MLENFVAIVPESMTERGSQAPINEMAFESLVRPHGLSAHTSVTRLWTRERL